MPGWAPASIAGPIRPSSNSRGFCCSTARLPKSWASTLKPLRQMKAHASLPATSFPKARNRWPQPMRGTSSAISFRNLATGGPSFLENSSIGNGHRRDIQLKGSGPTPFSRSGDGRAALGPVLREYLVSEAMAALHVPTTRALAAVTTGEAVYREQVLPGAVLTRVASSHVRIGTFQFFAARGDQESVRRLADYVIARHDPEAADAANPYQALLEGVCKRQARLVAQWMQVGFVHGVMNTDNMSISGETIDYGPCAFLDAYDPAAVFSSIDRNGRYAFANQPMIAKWNLARLAECLLPLFDTGGDAAVEEAYRILDGFAETFKAAYLAGFGAKLGLNTQREGDAALIETLLERMAQQRADFTPVSYTHLTLPTICSV